MNIFKLNSNAILPTKGTEKSSCYDISACLSGIEKVNVYVKGGKIKRAPQSSQDGDYIAIHPGERVQVPTGLVLDIPDGYDVKVYSRSGLSIKNGIRLANSVAVIDNDYKEELFVLLINDSHDTFLLHHGIRIAQFELDKVNDFEIVEVDKKPEQTTDRTGGLGSTGTKSSRAKKEEVVVEQERKTNEKGE